MRDWRTDGRTDGRKPIYLPPPTISLCVGHNYLSIQCWVQFDPGCILKPIHFNRKTVFSTIAKDKYTNITSTPPKPLVGECKPPETCGPRLFHRTWDGANWSRSYGIHKNLGAWWEFPKGPDGPMTMLLHIRGQDGSLELEMEQIGPAVVHLQHPQEFRCPTGIPARAW